mmetsp:Transcript_21780/g.46610  ORF Transcript_21780/g.46610 Transcript_21780/m.46610 type:complete len:177 (-) Transcript_21780:2-532(-)
MTPMQRQNILLQEEQPETNEISVCQQQNQVDLFPVELVRRADQERTTASAKTANRTVTTPVEAAARKTATPKTAAATKTIAARKIAPATILLEFDPHAATRTVLPFMPEAGMDASPAPWLRRCLVPPLAADAAILCRALPAAARAAVRAREIAWTAMRAGERAPVLPSPPSASGTA